jgi:hypothetical protein
MGGNVSAMKLYTDIYATPSRIQGLLRLVAKVGPSTQEASSLMEIALDRPGAEGKAMSLINAAKEANLIGEDPKGVLALKFEMSDDHWNVPNYGEVLVKIIDRYVLTPTINGSENRLATLAAWFMKQSPSTVPQGQTAIKSALTKHGFPPSELGLANDACVDMLIYWLKYLGFAWQYEARKCEGLVPDPTAFLTRHIDELLPIDVETKVNEFRNKVGEICPILDGGTVFEEVSRRMHLNGVPEMPNDQLSPSLSLALRRLKRSKAIDFYCPDDQRTFLMLANGEKIAFLRRIEGVC